MSWSPSDRFWRQGPSAHAHSSPLLNFQSSPCAESPSRPSPSWEQEESILIAYQLSYQIDGYWALRQGRPFPNTQNSFHFSSKNTSFQSPSNTSEEGKISVTAQGASWTLYLFPEGHRLSEQGNGPCPVPGTAPTSIPGGSGGHCLPNGSVKEGCLEVGRP